MGDGEGEGGDSGSSSMASFHGELIPFYEDILSPLPLFYKNNYITITSVRVCVDPTRTDFEPTE